jgi:alpha-ketoglutaric semialdehyde dehydrogenase
MTSEMCINRYEVFGLMASVIRVRDYGAGFAMANGTEFGLSGARPD